MASSAALGGAAGRGNQLPSARQSDRWFKWLLVAPAALLMHGKEADPVFCYANRTAQGLWGLTWDEFIRLPSRLSVEPLVQAERGQLLARVRAHGFIDDY